MRILLAGMMALLLLRAPETMAAAEAACALFVRSVMPGLFPYLTLSQMLVSRCGRDMQPGMLMLLGWCGGSPTGARLLAMQGSRPHREQKALAVSCATMSPMFLLGTIGSWLNSRIAGAIVLLSVLAGGCCAGRLAKRWTRVPARIDAAGGTAGVAGAARRDFGGIGAGNRAAGAERGRKFVKENL